MARREITQYYDDIDGSPLAAEDVDSIRFSLDGSHYVVDLSAKNAAAFREALAPYIKVASAAPALGRRGRGTGGVKRSNTRKVREWAREEGIRVSDRGTLPAHVYEAYDKAHS
ncbi:Nucleoid-associated protein Lsr2 [Corynebacterium atrinae]|uniref:histone-like nucleoid-structuring protein Lsr2 n=1 Tax=Corynebacterium atrinae TaxID=1336740 RepID=UPI0025B32830|nr:Lsr2 family protein [Corynebacterium atrinae]WJY64575.1 Nucleoid-associated protein Lsr2 [Corynebacterium atrinae]